MVEAPTTSTCSVWPLMREADVEADVAVRGAPGCPGARRAGSPGWSRSARRCRGRGCGRRSCRSVSDVRRSSTPVPVFFRTISAPGTGEPGGVGDRSADEPLKLCAWLATGSSNTAAARRRVRGTNRRSCIQALLGSTAGTVEAPARRREASGRHGRSRKDRERQETQSSESCGIRSHPQFLCQGSISMLGSEQAPACPSVPAVRAIWPSVRLAGAPRICQAPACRGRRDPSSLHRSRSLALVLLTPGCRRSARSGRPRCPSTPGPSIAGTTRGRRPSPTSG